MKNYHEAISCYNKALRLSPENAGAYYVKSLAYAMQNKDKEALVNLRMAIKLNERYALLVLREEAFRNIKSLEEFKNIIYMHKE